MEAVCDCKAHVEKTACKIRRSSHANADNAAQGRPLGLLTAWLLKQDDFAKRADHCNKFVGFFFSLEDRRNARAYFSKLPGAGELLKAERPRTIFEGEEPDGWA